MWPSTVIASGKNENRSTLLIGQICMYRFLRKQGDDTPDDSVCYECPLDVTYIISCIYLIDWVLIALLSPGLLYVWEDK